MNIRKYLPSDELGVRQLLLSNIPNGYFVLEDMNMLDNRNSAQNNDIPAYPPSVADYFFVLESDKITACAGFYILENEKRAHLTWGIVDAEYHNRGLGKLLFEYRVNKVKELYPGFKITPGTSQYTFKFFEKFGMKVESITPNGYGNNYDKYFMNMVV